MASKQPTTQMTLIIDIAHTSVGVAVLAQTVGMQPRMLAAWREELPHDVAQERLFERALRTMRMLIEKANSAGYASWDTVYCAVGTPWMITHVRSASYQPQKQFVVTEKILHNLDTQDLERFFSKDVYRESFADHRHIVDHQRLVVLANGHRLANAIGHTVRELAVTYLVSGMDYDQYAQLQSAIYLVTHREVVIHASHYLQWKMTSTLKNTDDYLFFDFHGGFGDVLVVRDDILQLTAASALSERRYLSELSEILNITIPETMRRIDASRRGLLRDDEERLLIEAEDVLFTQFQPFMQEYIQSIGSHGLLPTHTLVLADYGTQLFSRLLSMPQIGVHTVTQAPLKPIILDKTYLGNFIDIHGVLKTDSALAILALAVTRM